MRTMTLINKSDFNHDDAIKALKAVINILEKWGCSPEQKAILLGVKRSTFYKYSSNPGSAKIDINLTERLSYILNIHAALRILFSDPDSVYNWVHKPNSAPLFNGRSAMDIMLHGRVVDLADICRYLNAERGGWS